MNDRYKEAKQLFESIFHVPDFLDFDGEDYMYYGEDPVLEEQCSRTSGRWRGFSACWNKLHIPKNETVEHWEDRTGETYPDDGPVWEIDEWSGYRLATRKESENRIKLYGEGHISFVIASHHGKPS